MLNRSVEDSFNAYPFLFLLSLPHSYLLLLLLLNNHLFISLIYFLPPSFFSIRVLALDLFLFLLFRWTIIINLLSKSWEHLIDFLLICCRFLFYNMNHLLQTILSFHFSLFIQAKIREISLVYQIKICPYLISLHLIFLLYLFQCLFDFLLFLIILKFNFFLQIPEVFFFQSKLFLELGLNNKFFTL